MTFTSPACAAENANSTATTDREVVKDFLRPYDPQKPVVNMDEHSIQLVKETRTPEPTHPGKSERYDYEYERNGTAVNFMFTEPLVGWRKINVRERKTAVDWAQEIEELLETDYPEAETIVLVCDNLNTHTLAALYEAFPPDKARRWQSGSKSTTRPSTAVGSTSPKSNSAF